MYFLRMCLCILLFKYSFGNWVSEWLTPIQHLYPSNIARTARTNDITDFDESTDLSPIIEDESENTLFVEENKLSSSEFNTTLETTINKAKDFIGILNKEMSRVSKYELGLKDMIANGSLGVTVAKVSTIVQPPRSYLVTKSAWSVCSGDISFPADYPAWKTVPKCDDDEIPLETPEPCVFNSIIKYTIPSSRRSIYVEDDYLCQKNYFSDKFEKYMSVSPSVIQHTCKNGTASSLTEIQSKCGSRIVIEYIMYPFSFYIKHIPKGYCDSDHICRLTVAWHLSNVSFENFEFFDFDETFKQYFLSM